MTDSIYYKIKVRNYISEEAIIEYGYKAVGEVKMELERENNI